MMNFWKGNKKKVFPRKYRYYHNRSLQRKGPRYRHASSRREDTKLWFEANVLDIVTHRVTAWGHEALSRPDFVILSLIPRKLHSEDHSSFD